MIESFNMFEGFETPPPIVTSQDRDALYESLDDTQDISTMTEEEINEFKNSSDYKDFKIKTVDGNIEDEINTVDFEGKNVQEIFNLFGTDTKRTRYSYNCFDFLNIDHDTYMDMVDSSSIMQQTLEEGEELLPTFRYLHEDIFMSLYQYEPVLLSLKDMHIQSSMNRSILEKIINTPLYIHLRKVCRCDMFNAGVGTEIIGQKAMEVLKEELEKVKDFEEKRQALDDLIQKEQEMDDISDDIDDLMEQMEDLQFQDQDDPEVQRQMAELQAQLTEKYDNLQEARNLAAMEAQDCEDLIVEQDDIDGMADDIADGTSLGIVGELNTCIQEVTELEKTIQAWGLKTGHGSDNGYAAKIPYGVKRSILEKIRSSEYLIKFTDKIGKFKETAVAQQEKKDKTTVVEINSVTNGSKIEDTLSSDMINLCNDVTKKEFYKRMSENQLLTYEKNAEKAKNKGPIIVCLDKSGSMGGYGNDCDAPLDWGKALSVGILEIAQKQKREFACLAYDTDITDEIVIHKDDIVPEKILEVANIADGGGTSFTEPLKRCLDLIDQSEFKQADVVFITDGECAISNDFRRKFNQKKEEKEFRVLGVIVDEGGYHASDSSLKDFCDSITRISDIANADAKENKEIFGAL